MAKRTAEETKQKVGELFKRMGAPLFVSAYSNQMNLSAFIEREDPSSHYDDGLDTFERMLVYANIKTRSMPDFGVYADSFGAFDKSDQTRALAMEWVARRWRHAQTGIDPSLSMRSLYLSSDTAPGTVMRPYVDAARARYKQIVPAIPLSELVATTTTINTDAYRAFYLTDDTDQERMKRVAEGTEVPRAILKGADHTVRLVKYGRALEMSYEQLRRMQIDMVALHIARLAIQSESDKVGKALSVLISGDGNPATAASVLNLTTLDPAAVAGTLSLRGFLNFKLSFPNPYVMTTMLAQNGPILDALLLNVGNQSWMLVQVGAELGVGGMMPINLNLSTVSKYGITGDAPAAKIIGFDNRLALEHVIEVGANITEIEKFVSRQSQALVMTEVEGFAIFDQNATKVLDIAH